MTKKKRAKNEPTKGDLLAQSYRNRAAMFRVYESARREHLVDQFEEHFDLIPYWQPFDIRTLGM
jgi:uncharacterized protein YqeY